MKRFKKSEIAIYAISLMLVAAGYFNYTTFDKKTQETYSEDVKNISDETANVGDAVLVSNNETENKTETETETEISDTNKENTLEEQNKQDTQVATQNEKNTTDYYASSKLDRDKMYAEMISNYEKILNNSNVSEVQKTIATEEITKINNTKNAIMICENLILTKGFENCVVMVNDSSVNVIVHITNGLNTENVAKLQNIVSRELGTQIENIHISEK